MFVHYLDFDNEQEPFLLRWTSIKLKVQVRECYDMTRHLQLNPASR